MNTHHFAVEYKYVRDGAWFRKYHRGGKYRCLAPQYVTAERDRELTFAVAYGYFLRLLDALPEGAAGIRLVERHNPGWLYGRGAQAHTQWLKEEPRNAVIEGTLRYPGFTPAGQCFVQVEFNTEIERGQMVTVPVSESQANEVVRLVRENNGRDVKVKLEVSW